MRLVRSITSIDSGPSGPTIGTADSTTSEVSLWRKYRSRKCSASKQVRGSSASQPAWGNPRQNPSSRAGCSRS